MKKQNIQAVKFEHNSTDKTQKNRIYKQLNPAKIQKSNTDKTLRKPRQNPKKDIKENTPKLLFKFKHSFVFRGGFWGENVIIVAKFESNSTY